MPNNLEAITGQDFGVTKEHKFINNAVKRENFQRNFIKKGLDEAQDEDFILISDLDEIPNPKVINNFNLLGKDDEFLVLVGPSGCGKSTLLRMIAGLEQIDEGEIQINNEVINEMHPSKRHTAMVFQSYALYPHMNVYDNMSFGLKIEKKN